MEILKKALTLSVEERAGLANSLLESLDDATDPSVEAAWAEIVRRMEEIDRGKVKPVSLAEARWCRERSPVTAERFVAEVNRVLNRILEAPTR
jgi:putative addiction module component (TIGR02574 family)